MNRGKFLKQLIAALVVFQIAFGTTVVQTARAQESQNVNSEELKNAFWNMRFEQLKLENPLWQNFEDLLRQSDFSMHIEGNDPVVDQDPFFLRSQSWSNGSKSNLSFVDDVLNGYEYIKQGASVAIRVPGVQKNLHVNLPITPIQVTDDYIFFTADENSSLFEDKVRDLNEENRGEGLFFISTQELMNAAQTSLPVAIYFFPLPGNGWKGQLESYDFKETNQVVIQNADGQNLPIDIADVTNLMKYEQVVRLLATVDTMINSNGNLDPKIFIYPDPGTTAGFGLVGMDRKISFGERTHQILNQVAQWILPQANAFAVQFDPKVLVQLVFYGKLIASVLGGAIIAKYTVLKQKLDRIHELEKTSRAQMGVENPGKVSQFFQDVFSIFAHGTLAIRQIGSVTTGISVELFMDRTLPEYAAGEHKMLRKILNKTLLWSRKSTSQVAVNWKTFFLGTVVLGECVDTPFVAWQDLWFFPHFVAMIAPYMPAQTSQQLHEIFITNFDQAKQTLVPGVIRNGASWMMNGASNYSLDSRSQMLPRVQEEVDHELLRRGKNPKDPAIQTERENMINVRMDNISRQRGLPGSESFLFDLNTMFASITQKMGYQTDPSIANGGSFILEKRPALAKNVVRRALGYAQAQEKTDPSAENQNTVALFKRVLKDMSLLDMDLIKNPVEKLKRMQEVRKTLTLLSYEGDLTYAVSEWAQEFSPVVAMNASVIFHRALFSLLSADVETQLQLPDEIVRRFAPEADRLVREQIQNEVPEVRVDEWIRNNSAEYAMMLDQKIRKLCAKEAYINNIQNYQPPKEDWMAQRQRAKALSLTTQAISADTQAQEEFGRLTANENATAVTQKFKGKWQQEYSRALARTLGLYVDGSSAELLLRAHQDAEKATQNQVAGTPGLTEYMQKLSDFEQLKFESDIYASNFLAAYRNLTTQAVTALNSDVALEDEKTEKANWQKYMISSDQPGKTQRIRQTNQIVRNSKILTRTARWVDSFFEDEEYQVGIRPWLKRNIPFGNDFATAWTSFSRSIMTSSTVGYTVMTQLFHVNWPWATYMWFMILGTGFITVPSMWVNRFFRQQGLKAMDTVRSKAFYGLLYSPATMWSTIPFMLYKDDFSNLINNHIAPALYAMASAMPDPLIYTVAGASVLGLSPSIRDWVRGKIGQLQINSAENKSKIGLNAPVCASLF